MTNRDFILDFICLIQLAEVGSKQDLKQPHSIIQYVHFSILINKVFNSPLCHPTWLYDS